jgi:pSer/pThr/pTyr-binding forkhead associated (FHA) protein
MSLPDTANPFNLQQPRLVTFSIGNTDSRLVYPVDTIQQWIIGRRNPLKGFVPDIDLTDFGAKNYGVSRQHALISSVNNQFVTITDCYSALGVFVNGYGIFYGAVYKLRDGDVIRLGQMRLRVMYTNRQI